jgi:mannose-6-phosphate isomerase
MVSLLENSVRDYAWGSPDTIPALLGTEPTGKPQAELWMGAHESAPSVLASGINLYDAVQRDPSGVLGSEAAHRYDKRFPFLAKILAAAQPLSIQAHPSLQQAGAGFAREDAAGVPRDAPERNYKDAWPKPEILVALGTFEAMVGFRPLERTVALLEAVRCAQLADVTDALRAGNLREVFLDVLSTDRDSTRVRVAALGEACHGYSGSSFAAEAATLDRLAQDFPDDPGVLAAMLLNRVTLSRFDAVYLPAGNVHAYLHGTGFEVMANSDNVLRGGLTRKHIDVPELASVVDFTPLPDPVLRAPSDGTLSAYRTGCPYFDVHRVDLDGSVAAVPGDGGPRIVACLDGSATVAAGAEAVELTPGRSAFADGTEPPCTVTGRGTAFVVSVPPADS